MNLTPEERLRRWRLLLGAPGKSDGTGCALAGDDLRLDAALSALYDANPPAKDNRRVGMGASSPGVARWLGDIRRFFPKSVVQVMQRDAMERLDLKRLLLEPEMLEGVEPDVGLVGTLLSLSRVLPEQTKATARLVVRRVVEELERKLANPLRQAVAGSLNRAVRNLRPRHNEINWPRTIRANLKHYQPEYRTVVPATRIGYGRRQRALREVMLCIDQSGSMASSVVYAGLFGAVLASLPALKTHVVAYDTAVTDLTEHLGDPVELLFGTQLGGGNDTPRALRYCRGLITRPADTILVLISDLYEGALGPEMIRQLGALLAAGVQVIVLLALADDGAPSYEAGNAGEITALGAPVFACTPDLFPDLMAAAIQRRDISQWAAGQGIKVEPSPQTRR